MGNRFSRKKTKQQASAAGAAASQKEAVVAVLTSAPLVSELSDSGAPKDEKVEVVLPLSARQAPPTARDGSEGSPVDFFRRCYELEEDPFTLYTQALLLKDQREFAAASELLRSLLSNASLTIEARSHLAQCLIAQDPALSWCREEAAQCLEDVIAATSSASNNADSFHSIMYRESLELLAHVMIADKRFARALQLLDALQAELSSDASVSAALRQQQTLVSFQRAFCRYALGDSPDAVSAELLRVLPQKLEPTKEAQAQQPEQQQQQQQEEDEAPEPRDPLEGIELLLHADAASGARDGAARLRRPGGAAAGLRVPGPRGAARARRRAAAAARGEQGRGAGAAGAQERRGGGSAAAGGAALGQGPRGACARGGGAAAAGGRGPEAQQSRKLAQGEAREARKLLAGEIHMSVGARNESLALQAYERQTGSKVRLTNEHFYFLTFPAPPTADGEEALVDYSLLAEQSQRTVIRKRQSRQAAESAATVDLTTEDSDEDESVEEEESPDGYFSICGMVDGVADALTISADDEWGLTPVVVEVKNRVRGFRDPPPLYDHIQLAVYMKMLGVEHGDLVQCMYGADSCPNIQVSRVSLGVAPLCLPASSTEQRQRDIWTEVIVPRLYAFTAAVQKLRNEELLRLAFLNGTEEERLAIVRAECDFL